MIEFPPIRRLTSWGNKTHERIEDVVENGGGPTGVPLDRISSGGTRSSFEADQSVNAL